MQNSWRKRSAAAAIGRIVTAILTFMLMVTCIPRYNIANAYSSVELKIGAGGGYLSYYNAGNKQITRIDYSPQNMFDIPKCHNSNGYFTIQVKTGGSAERTGTIKMYKNSTLQRVITVKQGKIILEVKSLDPSNPPYKINGYGENRVFRIRSNLKVTAKLYGEITESEKKALGTYGNNMSGYESCWTEDVVISLPAFDYTPTATSITQTSSYQNRPRSIGIVFVADSVTTFSQMYSQYPKGFMFGQATASAPLGTICVGGMRYILRTQTTYDWSGGHTFEFGNGNKNFFRNLFINLSTMDISNGMLPALISALGNSDDDYTFYVTVKGQYACVSYCDSPLSRKINAIGNTEDPNKQELRTGLADYYNGVRRYFSPQRYQKKDSEVTDYYSIYVNGDNKLFAAFNYVEGDYTRKGDKLYYRYSYGYHNSGSTSISQAYYTAHMPAPIDANMRSVLTNNNLLGTYW